ncbi:MAG: efflux RND transporter periplasmic adaptor subunit [Pirellulaceae bacterium]
MSSPVAETPDLQATQVPATRPAPTTGRLAWKLLIPLAITAVATAAIIYLVSGRNAVTDGLITHTVSNRTVRDAVVERGTLESQNTVNGNCELPGWENKIIFIVPEGSTVKEGDVVVRFDSEEIDNEIAEQKTEVNQAEGQVKEAEQDIEVQKNTNASSIAAAELAVELAVLDLTKYRDGDFERDKADFQRSIDEGKAELEKIRDELENMRTLIRKGFRAREQLREIQLRLDSAENRVKRDELNLQNLIAFDRPRKIKELQFNSEETARLLDRARKTAEAESAKAAAKLANAQQALQLQTEQLKELEAQLEKCEIKAPQPGTVAYANRPWFDDDERIREGATVRRRQDVFYLPDMRRMQVEVNVHESVVNKVKDGQRVIIRTDADRETVLYGTINRVSQLATSSWGGSTKTYQVIVFLDDFPEEVQLKPGMTAECEILVGTYEDIIAVPVNAVTEHFQQSYVYAVQGDSIVRQKVKIGRTTTSFLEITEGVEADDELVLDAYQRGLQDFGEAERDADALKSDVAPTPQPAAGGEVVAQ